MSTSEHPDIVVRLAASDEEWIGSPVVQEQFEEPSAPHSGTTADQHVHAAGQHRQHGDLARAIAEFQAALTADRHCAAAYAALGQLLIHENRAAEAVEVYQAWLRDDPQQPQAANGLGVALQSLGRYDESEVAFRRGLRLRPGDAATLNNLGTLLRLQGKPHEGLPLLRRAIELDPDDATTLTNLSFILLNLGQITEANVLSRQAIAKDPDSGNGQLMLGFGLVHQARISEALQCFDAAHTCSSASPVPVANYLFTTLYSDELTAADKTALHREFAAKIPFHGTTRTQWNNSRDPHRRLRIGYLSHDLRSHPVAFFLEPLLQHHNSANIEVTCYSTNPSADETTQRLMSCAHRWREVAAFDDDQLEAQILRDEIDILVDLSGHTSCNRAGLLRRKPAPIQVLYIGYPSTSGMSEMDYLISDGDVSPPQYDELYTETVIRLPGSFWCYCPHAFAEPPNLLPAMERGSITFGSFNNSSKLSPSTIRLWADVLKAVPHSQLMLKALAFADEATRQLFARQFHDAGLSPDRLRLEPPTMQIEQFMRSYHELDIALDTTPYNGGTTTCEALWMGVPVISLVGQHFMSRMGLSFLKSAGLNDLAVTSPDDFVRVASALAHDLPRLTALRSSLRQTLSRSPVCDAKGTVRELEDAFRQMWQAWCQDSTVVQALRDEPP